MVICFEPSSGFTSVKRQIQEMFAKKSRAIDNISSTKEAFVQYMRKAIYQGVCVCVWRQALATQPTLPCQSDYEWVPFSTSLLQTKDICYESARLDVQGDVNVLKQICHVQHCAIVREIVFEYKR